MFIVNDYAVVHKGLKRDSNQDNIYLNGFYLPEIHDGLDNYTKKVKKTNKSLVYAVFDGIGGLDKGEYASSLASTMLNNLQDQNVFDNINQALLDYQKDKQIKLGTTATVVLLKGRYLHFYQIGDSPLFIYHHHLKKYLLDASENNLLNNYLGKGSNLQIKKSTIKLHHNDKIILCSDGLTNDVEEDFITKTISSNNDGKYIADKLLNQALINGGNDNISIITLIIKRNYLVWLLWIAIILLLIIILLTI